MIRVRTVSQVKKEVSWVHGERWGEADGFEVAHCLASLSKVQAAAFGQNKYGMKHLVDPTGGLVHGGDNGLPLVSQRDQGGNQPVGGR